MLTAKGIAGAAELTIAAAGKYSSKGVKTLNKDGKQRNESRIIKWNSFLLSLYPPQSLSRYFCSQLCQADLRRLCRLKPLQSLDIVANGCESH